MKKSILLVLFSAALSFAQEWTFTDSLSFPIEDSSIVQPFLGTIDAEGRLYVASSRAASATAHNIIYYADSTNNTFTKLIDYTALNDTDYVSSIRGIAAWNKDIFIFNNQRFGISGGNTLATCYRIKNGDITSTEKFGSGIAGAGYGTYGNGLAVTDNQTLITGIPFQGPSIRMYNFNDTATSAGYGGYIPPAANQIEPGGAHTNGVDVIRDVAIVQGASYLDPETPIFTIRNSDDLGKGGVAIWVGGDERTPANYTPARVTDFFDVLKFGASIPYGIDYDEANEALWISGTDSNKVWVKAFSISGTSATEIFELPSMYSKTNPNPAGAPMRVPSDVAISRSGLIAYVLDAGAKKVWKFEYKDPSGVEDDNVVSNYSLDQNYPNPFNPSTVISYSLPKAGNVKVTITNSLGQVIETLYNGFEAAGKHSKTFNAKNLSSGMYFYTLTTDAGNISKKMMFVK